MKSYNFIRYFIKYFLLFLCFAFSSELCAQGVFTVLPTDKSVQYLGIIFGGNVGAVTLGGGANPMLSKMFQYFNVIILGFGVIILAWVGLVALVNTAREGEAMGRKFSLWVPIRGLFGMLLLIPSPGSGYSLIQMTVMWIVLNGIGAANGIWTIILNQLALGVPSVGAIQINIANGQLDGLARSILMSLTCMNSFNQFQSSSLYQNYGPVRIIVQAQGIQYAPNQNAPTTLSQAAIVSVGVPSLGNPSVPDPTLGALCGSYNVNTSICNAASTSSTNTSACQGTFNAASITQRLNYKVGAMLAMFNVLGPAATQVATSSTPPQNGYFSAAYDAYRSGIAALAGGVNMPVGQPPTIGSPGFTAQNLGLSNAGGQANAWFQGQVSTNEAGLKSTGPALQNYGALGQGGYQTTAQAIGMGGGGAMGTGQATTAAEAAGIGTAQAAKGVATEAGLYAAAPAILGGSYAVQYAAPTIANVGNFAVQAWEQQSQVTPVTQTQVNNLLQFGWIHAGSYYYSLSQSSAQSPLGGDLQNIPSPVSQTQIPTQTGTLVANVQPQEWTAAVYSQLGNDANRSAYNNALINANQFYLADHNFTPATSLPSLGSGQASTGNQFLDQIVNALSSSYRQPIMNFIQNQLMGTGSLIQGASTDPLITIGTFGWTMMMAGEISVFVVIALCFTLLLALAAGSCMSPLAWAVNALAMQIFGVILGVVTLLWTAGATLGVYTPLVPYIIFTTTAFGWLLVVTEALVGAPIVALALVQPGGEELGNIKEGLGMIVNVFMRPTLMLFGFILAAGVLRGGLTLINFGFMKAVNDSVLPTIFSIIPTIGIYTFLVVAVVNQAFSLIYELPNRIMTYMGMRHEGFGGQVAEKMTGQAKEGFQAGAQMAQKGVSAMSEKGMAAYGQVSEKLGKAKRTSIGGGVI